MLRRISDLLAQGHSWRLLFNHTIRDILAYLGSPTSAQVAGLYGLYTLLQEATMDEVQLRRIDMLAHIRCTCDAEKPQLLADGVWVGCQLRYLYMDAPHLPRLSAVGGVSGSTFQRRIVLPCSKGRDALWDFVQAKDQTPMDGDAFAKMCELISPAVPLAQHCKELRAFVECVAPQVRRQM